MEQTILWTAGETLTLHQMGQSDAVGYRAHHLEREACRIEFCRGGDGYVQMERDGTVQPVTAGQIILIGPDTPVTIWADRDRPWQSLYFVLSGTLLRALWSLYRIPDLYIGDAAVMDSLLELRKLFEDTADPARLPEESARAVGLVSALLPQVLAHRLFPVPMTDTVPRRMQSYIDGHLYEELTLDSLAARFGYAKMHLIRLFRDEIGVTPIQYVLRRRMDAACKMLTGTIMPISEIAALLQYSSARHFAAAFRKHTGLSPSAYRDRGGEGAKTE